MPERFLGIDTSNYRTSAAIYNAETGEWVNRGGLLTVPEGAIGLRQSDALFQHTVRLHEKIEALPQGEVRAIGVSTRPRAVEGSYMLALTAEPEKGFKPKVNECKFSLSGMQNQVENKFKTAEPKQMARFALETVANAVIKATEQAREQYHCPILCAGGVMASQIIRARMNKRFGGEVSFAEPTLSGDNAVGVAVLAAKLCNR